MLSQMEIISGCGGETAFFGIRGSMTGLDTSLAKEMNWNADTGIAAMDYNGHIVALKDGKCLEWECPISIESRCFTECLRYSDSLESLIQMSRSIIPSQLY